MDYDQSGIATAYDEARALTPARRRRWQRLLSAHVDRTAVLLVVDLGCGTGRFSEMLATELGAQVVGLDPSEKMIDQARRKPATSPVIFGRASAHELPLPDYIPNFPLPLRADAYMLMLMWPSAYISVPWGIRTQP